MRFYHRNRDISSYCDVWAKRLCDNQTRTKEVDVSKRSEPCCFREKDNIPLDKVEKGSCILAMYHLGLDPYYMASNSCL